MSHSNLIPDSPRTRDDRHADNHEHGQSDKAASRTRVVPSVYAAVIICLLSAVTIGWLFFLGWFIKQFV